MEENLVFGFDPHPGIVAAHLSLGSESEITLYARSNGVLETSQAAFYPFFFLSEEARLRGAALVRSIERDGWVKKLAGENHFGYLCVFRSLEAMRNAAWAFDDLRRAARGDAATQPFVLLRHDPATQYLMQSGKTLFKGMEFDQLRRLQIAFRFAGADDGESVGSAGTAEKLIVASLADSHGWHWSGSVSHAGERELLEQVVGHIRRRDPDVIEGHGIHGGALARFLGLCDRHDVDVTLGRDGSQPQQQGFMHWRRAPFAARDGGGDLTVAGRHIIDTARLAGEYAWAHGMGGIDGAPLAARALGGEFAALPSSRSRTMHDAGTRDAEFLLQEAREETAAVRHISERLLPAYFNAARMVPMNLDALAHSGSTAKIEAMMLREYLRARTSVPAPAAPKPLGGGLTDVFIRGVVGPVALADVDSLYPSLMLCENIAPRTDQRGAFLAILGSLKTLRIEMKSRFRAETNPLERARLDGLQSSFKILINSFYGYLGYARGLFNDYDAANRVTAAGQRILRELMARVRERGGRVVEADTDGVFFIPPDGVRGETAERAFVAWLSDQLPEGITVSFNGRYERMFSYKKKNYALLDSRGNITLKGSSLLARSMERFGAEFIRGCIERLLRGDIEGVHALYSSTRAAVAARTMTIEDFARVESVRESLKEYRAAVAAGARNPSAAYEAAITAQEPIRHGSAIAYYIIGGDPNVKLFTHAKLANQWDPHFPDENTPYYLRRLDDVARKFEPFFTPADFEKIFSDDSLFQWDSSGVAMRTFEVKEHAWEQPAPPSEGN